MKFIKGVHTDVPACAMVEVYQMLAGAINGQDWDLAKVALDCIAEDIEQYTVGFAGVNVKPSGSALIAMDCQSGLITDDQGRDYQCMAGKDMSLVLSGGVCQCPDDCPHCKCGKCAPEDGEILMEGGFLFELGQTKGETLIAHLEQVDKNR